MIDSSSCESGGDNSHTLTEKSEDDQLQQEEDNGANGPTANGLESLILEDPQSSVPQLTKLQEQQRIHSGEKIVDQNFSAPNQKKQNGA